MNQSSLVNMAFSATLLIAASNVQAVTVSEAWVNYNPLIGGGEAEYTVTNDTGSDIYAFIVGNDAATNTSTSNNGWDSTIVSSFEWDDLEVNMSINFLGGVDNPIYTSDLGAFNTLFAGFNQAIMYTFNVYNQNGLDANPDALPIASGATRGGFNYTTEILASPFIAIDQSGNIVGSGNAVHVSAVPVPAAVWLFGSGLLALAGFARRKV